MLLFFKNVGTFLTKENGNSTEISEEVMLASFEQTIVLSRCVKLISNKCCSSTDEL